MCKIWFQELIVYLNFRKIDLNLLIYYVEKVTQSLNLQKIILKIIIEYKAEGVSSR